MKLIFVFTEEEQDDEEVYKMASIMSSSGGLEAMLNRYLYCLTEFLPLVLHICEGK